MQLLIRDNQHHFSLIETQPTTVAPLHISLPRITHSSSSAIAPTLLTASSSLTSPVSSLPLDALLLITSFLQPPALSTLTAVSRDYYAAFIHNAHWRQLSQTLGWYQNRPLERVQWRSFVLSRQSTLARASFLWWQLKGRLSILSRATLCEPLALTDLMAHERSLGALLPPSLRASLLVHDGQSETVPVGHGLVDGCRLLSCREIVSGGVMDASETAGGSGRLVCVTSVSGVNCVLVSVVDGSVWLSVGRSGVLVWQCDDWLHFLARLFSLSGLS